MFVVVRRSFIALNMLLMLVLVDDGVYLTTLSCICCPSFSNALKNPGHNGISILDSPIHKRVLFLVIFYSCICAITLVAVTLGLELFLLPLFE